MQVKGKLVAAIAAAFADFAEVVVISAGCATARSGLKSAEDAAATSVAGGTGNCSASWESVVDDLGASGGGFVAARCWWACESAADDFGASGGGFVAAR